MIRNSLNSLLLFIVAILILSCNNKRPASLGAESYLRWISSTESNFVKVKTINNFNIQVKYLPSQYLAYREFMNSDSLSYDSLLKSYACGLSFQILLHADKNDKHYYNLQYYGLTSEEELAARIRYLSFGIENFISIKHNENLYLPILSNFEGFDFIGNRLSFQVVFVIPEYNCGRGSTLNDLILSFEDPYWSTGKSNFEFKGVDILRAPQLDL
ncbi:hypothetical protein [Chryseosolibacter indicus]|uniref:Lipoprotein n=1 Tax=Chryseosolibacter indicus TaxID=2782351 RepID=A0ABS5VVZ8_9BACT|nr:hypothetical protein [Chryseosolibacter indicus]MBT1705602.1 hypothetical protein [Chryseosolibacter indicus]